MLSPVLSTPWHALQNVKQRIFGSRIPPISVAARSTRKSLLLSMDDDSSRPSAQQIQLALDTVIQAAQQVSIADIERPGIPDWFYVWPGEHYRLLAAFMVVLQPKTVLEIGTFKGLSALAMKKYLPATGRIVTFDLKPWQSFEDTFLCSDDFADGRLSQELGNLADPDFVEEHRTLLEATDFFFIDGPKDNITEYKIIENFQNLNFKNAPILLFDDTRLWNMLKFWRTLPFPKLDLTSFGHWSGTGLVEWRQRPLG
ncbi:O-methyltransferase [Anthocerotibacter panamensis]|uniref:O-methyltransferase n=1 Tax=Anthocerotibacter panamensis TaxID=2857077 RepID=UPI001C403C89|nr:class I SAM-dependent methyltransferase [Anthocerotibacter panamensis]